MEKLSMKEYEMVEECAHHDAPVPQTGTGSNWTSDKAPTLTYV